MIECGKNEKCGAGAPAREKPRSAMGFGNGILEAASSPDTSGSFARTRLQPGRNHARESGALAPEGVRAQ